MEFYEHIGTHMDAPSHFGGQGRQAMHEIPPDRLIGPGVVIDVKAKAKKDPNYEVTIADLKEYEDKHGRIPSGAIVLMNSGWSKKYPVAEWVFGTNDITNVFKFNFPGFSLPACKFLLRRRVSMLGVDTPSLDPGQTKVAPYACHTLLQPNNIPLLEYVANLDNIPVSGTTVFLGGIRTRGGTGGPTRVLAVVDDDTYDDDN